MKIVLETYEGTTYKYENVMRIPVVTTLGNRSFLTIDQSDSNTLWGIEGIRAYKVLHTDEAADAI